MKTIKSILFVAVCLIANTAFSQNYIPYYPTNGSLKIKWM